MGVSLWRPQRYYIKIKGKFCESECQTRFLVFICSIKFAAIISIIMRHVGMCMYIICMIILNKHMVKTITHVGLDVFSCV